jgi:flagellar motility protein MotE (MotC chaperone)
MTDEPKQQANADGKEAAEEKAAPKKSGIVKYLLMGIAGIALVAGAAVATLFFLGNEPPASTESADAEAVETEPANEEEADSFAMFDEALDSLMAEDLDRSVMEMVGENLAALDYDPEAEGAGAEKSSDDSLASASWLEKEKAALAQKEQELNTRQKELQQLEKKLSQALLEIEQAESARITKLAKLYDGMEPSAVAELMANLDDETVVAILPKMKAKKASAVLQLLPAKRAAELSKRMITIADNVGKE